MCTYCASCSGSFARKGFDQADHILLKILGSTEKPDTGKSMINRMKTKYWQGGIYGKEENIKNIIAVDLNSADETKQILEKLSNEYENIKVANWKECKDLFDNIDDTKL